MFTYYKNSFIYFFKAGLLEIEKFFLCMSDCFKGGYRMKLLPSILVFNNDFTLWCSAPKQV